MIYLSLISVGLRLLDNQSFGYLSYIPESFAIHTHIPLLVCFSSIIALSKIVSFSAWSSVTCFVPCIELRGFFWLQTALGHDATL